MTEKERNGQYTDNSGNDFIADVMLPCPFCGSEPEMMFIGNNHTKSRKVTIKCTNKMCRAQMTNAGLRSSHRRVAMVSIEAWNNRAWDRHGA